MTISKWLTLVRQCLLRRVSVREFGELLQTHQSQVDGKRLFKALFECRASFCPSGDPLLSLYLDHVGTTGDVSVSDAILVLIWKWNATETSQPQGVVECYSLTLQDITMIIVSPKYKSTASEARTSLLLSSRWLSSLARQMPHQTVEPSHTGNHHVIEALAFLVVSMAATDGGLEALSSMESSKDGHTGNPAKELRNSLRQGLELCLPLYSAISTQLMERINTILKHISLLDEGSSHPGALSSQSSEMQALQFQMTIPDTQIAACKAATLVYLESMLSAGSTMDDGTIVNYLCSRHQNDYQAVCVDLLLTSFRALRTSSSMSTRRLSQQQCQIFIQNKLPVLISMVSASSFNSVDTEQTIIHSWNQVASQPSSQDLLMTGFRFLHTCSLHHLMTQQAAAQLIGNDELLSRMSKGLYTKDDLFAQVHSNHTRGPKLVDELVRSDGSAGSISQAVVEIMHNYCSSKETQYLKDLATAILRKPGAINCICLFIRPAYWLGPLCTLLDEWRWDEIHGEAQPVYDEFGSIFLLILVSRARLGLSKSDLGIRKRYGFLAEYLDNGDSENGLGNLSDERRTHLGNWINALYLAECLSDELFTNCSPHDFYILIPALLRQSITAYQQGKLTQESLKTGLEFLREPFLLPSLASALNWISNNLCEDPGSSAVVLEAIVKQPGGPESQAIHQTILAMSAPRLEKQIKSVQSQEDKFDAVTRILNQCPEFSFSLEQAVSTDHSRLLEELRHAIVTLITAAGTLDTEEPSKSQNIPSMANRAVDARGVEATLRALIEVLLQLSDSHDFLFALDTVSTIVCIVGQGLRDALRLQHNNLGPLLQKGDTLSAEAVVRLHRQVETYAGLLTVQDMGLDAFTFAQQLTNIDTADPNLDGSAAMVGVMSLPQDLGPADSIDQVLDEVAAMGNLDSNDADMSFDALYGLQSTDMDLNDLDLDMF